MPVLSVLIPTTPDRELQFSRLYFKLLKQASDLRNNHEELGEVQIIYDDSKRYLDGGFSIGEKRQSLLERATGGHLCFLDSDEGAAPNYLEELVRAILDASVHQRDDIITFNAIVKNDFYWAIIEMSLNNQLNEEVNPNGIIKRRPWHICPIKSEIANSESFSPLNHNEDWDWMERVLKKVNTETHIDKILTQYNHSEKNSEADKIIRAGHE
jgi:hypothetical protein